MSLVNKRITLVAVQLFHEVVKNQEVFWSWVELHFWQAVYAPDEFHTGYMSNSFCHELCAYTMRYGSHKSFLLISCKIKCDFQDMDGPLTMQLNGQMNFRLAFISGILSYP